MILPLAVSLLMLGAAPDNPFHKLKGCIEFSEQQVSVFQKGGEKAKELRDASLKCLEVNLPFVIDASSNTELRSAAIEFYLEAEDFVDGTYRGVGSYPVMKVDKAFNRFKAEALAVRKW